MNRREVNLEGEELVYVTVSSGGPAFDASGIVARVNRGAWLETEMVEPESGGVARVSFLCAPAELGLERYGEYLIEARHTANPETIIMAAGKLVVT